MTDKETADLAYWERNMLALLFAEGWYNDDDETGMPRYLGWRRVLTLVSGAVTFHIPDDFDVGNLQQLDKPNWDGHTTEEKWREVAKFRGIQL